MLPPPSFLVGTVTVAAVVVPPGWLHLPPHRTSPAIGIYVAGVGRFGAIPAPPTQVVIPYYCLVSDGRPGGGTGHGAGAPSEQEGGGGQGDGGEDILVHGVLRCCDFCPDFFGAEVISRLSYCRRFEKKNLYTTPSDYIGDPSAGGESSGPNSPPVERSPDARRGGVVLSFL